MDRVSAGASLLFPAGPVLMEFATMVGGRGEIKKDVDFPEAGEDTALCDKENKPPRIAQGSSNVFINNQPAARKGDKLECSAAIVEGSPDVFIGGEQVTYLVSGYPAGVPAMAENDPGRNNDSQLSSAASRTAGKTGESGETGQTGKPAGEKREAAGRKARRVAGENR
ncbi:TPA: PAAR domain-containing protein [Escherichia coli]|nr:PAAR domain-containing protein [Escherichia coli]